MAGVWSRLASGFSARMAPLRRGLKTGETRKGGGNHPDGFEGENIDKIRITYSRWNDRVVLNTAALWMTIVGMPLGAISFYTNVFIGPAKIAPIPEGYEPEDYEYSWHPITRFVQKHFHRPEQQWYEMTMHDNWEKWRETHKLRLLAEVKRQMASEGDYAAYYYYPSAAKYMRVYKEKRQNIFDDHDGTNV